MNHGFFLLAPCGASECFENVKALFAFFMCLGGMFFKCVHGVEPYPEQFWRLFEGEVGVIDLYVRSECCFVWV